MAITGLLSSNLQKSVLRAEQSRAEDQCLLWGDQAVLQAVPLKDNVFISFSAHKH